MIDNINAFQGDLEVGYWEDTEINDKEFVQINKTIILPVLYTDGKQS